MTKKLIKIPMPLAVITFANVAYQLADSTLQFQAPVREV
jgi:hypothetical protein